jgi:hypothetical protein
MGYMDKEFVTLNVVPIFIKAMKDDIPNVQFCISRILTDKKALIDANVFSNQLVGPLKDMS